MILAIAAFCFIAPQSYSTDVEREIDLAIESSECDVENIETAEIFCQGGGLGTWAIFYSGYRCRNEIVHAWVDRQEDILFYYSYYSANSVKIFQACHTF